MAEYPIGSTAKIYRLKDGGEVTLRHLIAVEPELARSMIIEGERAKAENKQLRKIIKAIIDLEDSGMMETPRLRVQTDSARDILNLW